MEFQMRNCFASGSAITSRNARLQHRCVQLGEGRSAREGPGRWGRQVRTGIEFGEIFATTWSSSPTPTAPRCSPSAVTSGTPGARSRSTRTGQGNRHLQSLQHRGRGREVALPRGRQEPLPGGARSPLRGHPHRLRPQRGRVQGDLDHDLDPGSHGDLQREVDMEKALASETDLMPERLAWDASALPALEDGSYPIPAGVSAPY